VPARLGLPQEHPSLTSLSGSSCLSKAGETHDEQM